MLKRLGYSKRRISHMKMERIRSSWRLLGPVIIGLSLRLPYSSCSSFLKKSLRFFMNLLCLRVIVPSYHHQYPRHLRQTQKWAGFPRGHPSQLAWLRRKGRTCLEYLLIQRIDSSLFRLLPSQRGTYPVLRMLGQSSSLLFLFEVMPLMLQPLLLCPMELLKYINWG